MKERVAAFISGDGASIPSMVRATQLGEMSVDFPCVISTPYARGIKTAKEQGIGDVYVIDPKKFLNVNKKIDQEKFGSELLRILEDNGVTIVIQDGWELPTPNAVINGLKGQVFRQHPGPLPQTARMHDWRQIHETVLYLKRSEKGQEMDTDVHIIRTDGMLGSGNIVKSATVKVEDGDTPIDLQRRTLPVMCLLQTELLWDIAEGKDIKEIPLGNQDLMRRDEKRVLLQARKAAQRLYPQR